MTVVDISGELLMDDKWNRNVRESPAAVTARQLLDLLRQLDAPDENIASDLAKVRRQAERIDWVLANCDPYLAPQSALDASQTHLVAATAAATEYQTSHDPAQLAGAMTNTEAALAQLSTLAIPAESVAPAESIANLGQTISDQMERASAQMSELVAQLHSKVSEVEEQSLAAETRNAELVARVEQLKADVEALRTSTTTLTTQWQASFTEEQTARGEQFRTTLEEQRTQGTTAISALEKTTKTSIANAETDVAAALANIEEQKALAEEIVGIISDEALIGEPSKRAAEDKKAAFWWSVGAVVFGAVAAVLAVVSIFGHSSSDNDTDWVGFALRALAVLAIGGLGAYAAREASEHRRSQRELDHLAVQLAAIKPFLRDMTETNRDEVMKGVAAKLFGPRLVDPLKGDDVDLPAGTAQLMQLLLKLLQTK